MYVNASQKIQVFSTPFFAGSQHAVVILKISLWALAWLRGRATALMWDSGNWVGDWAL